MLVDIFSLSCSILRLGCFTFGLSDFHLPIYSLFTEAEPCTQASFGPKRHMVLHLKTPICAQVDDFAHDVVSSWPIYPRHAHLLQLASWLLPPVAESFMSATFDSSGNPKL